MQSLLTFENGALSEFGRWRELRDIFSKVDLAIKSLKFEWNEGSIYRVLGLGLMVIW